MAGPDLAAVVLAAGRGERLRPLSDLRPKPLCPVGDETLLDLALARAGTVVTPGPDHVAVNAHHLADQVAAAVDGRATLSREEPEALGTAGALGALGGWLDGRDVLITNGDVVHVGELDLAGFVAGWDRRRPRLLVVEDRIRPDFDGRWRFAGVSLLAGSTAASLPTTVSGLYEAVWRAAALDLVDRDVDYVDCADPTSYLRAALLRTGGRTVVCPGGRVDGVAERCLVWPGATVHDGEHLVESVRAIDAAGREITVAAPLTTMSGRFA